MVEIGKLDRITVIIGERGMGKSTLTMLDAREFQRTCGGYVIGHSPNGQIGAADDIEFHSDLRRMARGLKRRPEKIHIVTAGPPEDVLRYGTTLCRAIKKRAFKKAHPLKRYKEDRPAPRGLCAAPVLVIIDEGVAMRRNPTHPELAELERLLTSARHLHLALTWSSQAPTTRQWVLLEQASGLRVFRYTHQYGLTSLQAAGIPRDVVAQLPQLRRFWYYHFDKMRPTAGEFRQLPPP
jgi:hypothetical protein